ncbi:MAG: hypothetical protein M1833_000263 [Piccolia ochrophora]|nr:MAG: hypothetical protein M1833_000263 [Piccolia ochrophora]
MLQQRYILSSGREVWNEFAPSPGGVPWSDTKNLLMHAGSTVSVLEPEGPGFDPVEPYRLDGNHTSVEDTTFNDEIRARSSSASSRVEISVPFDLACVCFFQDPNHATIRVCLGCGRGFAPDFSEADFQLDQDTTPLP